MAGGASSASTMKVQVAVARFPLLSVTFTPTVYESFLNSFVGVKNADLRQLLTGQSLVKDGTTIFSGENALPFRGLADDTDGR